MITTQITSSVSLDIYRPLSKSISLFWLTVIGVICTLLSVSLIVDDSEQDTQRVYGRMIAPYTYSVSKSMCQEKEERVGRMLLLHKECK